MGTQHILRQCKYHRAAAPRHRHMKGVAHHLAHTLGIVNLGHPFADRGEHVAVVHFLESRALHEPATDLADEQNHGGGVLVRGVQSDSRLACAGRPGDKADAGAAGRFGVGLGHEHGRALMAAHHQLDGVAVGVQGVDGR